MKRLALLLATTVATACGASNPPPCTASATIDWGSGLSGTGLHDANGTPIDCQTATATWVDVFVNGAFAGTFDCGAGAGTVPVARGGNNMVVEAGRGQADILFRDFFSVSAASCGPQGTFPSAPAQGWLAVDYSFVGGAACFAPTSYMSLAVQDDTAGQPSFSDSTQLCALAPAPAPKYAVALGNYTLIGINEWFGSSIVAADCRDYPFSIAPAATTTVSPVLSTTSSTACF
jgi:hypothetical protein